MNRLLLSSSMVLVLLAGACSDERPIALPPSNVGMDRRLAADVDGGASAEDATGADALADDATVFDPRDGAIEDLLTTSRDGEVGPDLDAGESMDSGPAIDSGSPLDSGPPADSGARADAATMSGVDLSIAFGGVIPTRLSSGGNLGLVLDVTNAGTMIAPATDVLVDLRLATAPVSVATRLTVVATQSLGPGGRQSLGFTVVLPATLAPGSYVLRAVVDPDGVVPEADETNNAAEITAAAVGLEVTPTALTIGPTTIGCAAAAATLTLTNLGALAATVDGATIVGTGELGISGLQLPRTVAPGATSSFGITYRPTNGGADQASLELRFEQGVRGTLIVPLEASGALASMHTDRFTQTANTPRLDLLFMIDDSGSMSDKQTQLANQVPAFLTWAQNNNVDFRVAVVTSDMDDATLSGRFQGSPLILTPGTPDLAAAFAANIQRGVNGSGNEQGLAAIVAALTPPLSTTTNQGFLRADAALGVLVLSDEEDFSTIAVTDAIAALEAAKPMGTVRVNAIVTPAIGCMTGVSAGTRYLAVAQHFGGTVESICAASWQTSLTTWGMVGGLRARFALSRAPRAGSIAVQVNGAPAPGTSWVYDTITNAVVFTAGNAPASGAAIEITYIEACAP